MNPLSNTARITVELAADDWLSLCALHAAVQQIGVKNMGSDPLLYSKISRITNDIEHQVTAGVAGILNNPKDETGG